MLNPTKVYPTKASALNIPTPDRPKLVLEGSFWPMDSMTARRLADGSVTTEAAKAYAPPVEVEAGRAEVSTETAPEAAPQA